MKDLLLCAHVVDENLKFGNFTLSFDGLRQRIVKESSKSVPHEQHAYFSSCNQSIIDLAFQSSFLHLLIHPIARKWSKYWSCNWAVLDLLPFCNMNGTCVPDMRKILAADEMNKRNNFFWSLSFCQRSSKTHRERIPCISLKSFCS